MNNLQSFFILSNPRSGSSLLRVICDSHSQITVPPECGFTEWWYKKYGDWKISDNGSERFEEYCKDLASSRKIETWHLNFQFFKDLVSKFSPVNYSELSELVYLSFGLERKKEIKVWGDKNNYYLHKTGLLKKLYPNAKFVYLIRDGRDVATSYIALKSLKSNSPYVPVLPTKIEEIAREWESNNQKILSFIESLEEDQKLVIKYEDLIKNLEEQCKVICDFLNLEFEGNMLNYYKLNKKHALEPEQTLAWKKKTLKSPDRLKIGKYKKLLSEEEISIFNSIAQKTLKQYRYEV